MEPEQISSIINSMPEGRRKQACVIVKQRMVNVGKYSYFWRCIKRCEYGKAAEDLLLLGYEIHSTDQPEYGPYLLIANNRSLEILADMIWEG